MNDTPGPQRLFPVDADDPTPLFAECRGVPFSNVSWGTTCSSPSAGCQDDVSGGPYLVSGSTRPRACT